jgi:hypothetical protein
MKINVLGILGKLLSQTSLAKDLFSAAMIAVAAADKPGLSSAQKRAAAQRAIRAALKKKYDSVPNYVINLAIELMVASGK